MATAASTRPPGAEGALTFAVFFASGFAGLVYQVLWMRELGLLFGNDAYAAATTLAAFFLGLAAGGAAFGRAAERMARPLRGYAWLEAAVALSALLYFGLVDLFHAVYAPLFDVLGDARAAVVALKFALGLVVLFPPAFFMGGTLPVMSQHAVRRADALGATAAGLYALNTLGAAAGAFAAAFLLVPHLGVTGAYGVALATTAAVAAVAGWLTRGAAPARPVAPAPAAAPTRGPALPAAGVRALAFLSGWATLALEVLWTRMFAQVLHNSVYTFAVILVSFLLALAGGAAVARLLAARIGPAAGALVALLVAGAAGVMTTPFSFVWRTHGLQVLAAQAGFASYVAQVFACAALVLALPTLCLGVVFPYLLKLAEAWGRSPGRTVGELAALNTLGAVAGSLSAGFVMLEALGLWASLGAVAAVYLVAGAAVALASVPRRRGLALAASLGGLAALLLLYRPSALPLVAVPDDPRREVLVEALEGSAATVAVVRQGHALRMRLDNHYGLGGSSDRHQEARQAHIPLALHRAPHSAFFLGLGTGITAGAALQHPLDEVWVAELVPEVVEAARRHFRPWLGSLFQDPRGRVLVEDGRNVLLGTSRSFDVIVADLFTPWKAGVGSLYTREHYEAARARLAPGGLYGQWLLLTQLSREEFGAIARTLAEVFPRVTLWRGNARVTHPLVLLLGERDPAPLDLAAIDRNLAAIERDEFDRRVPGGENAPIPENAEKLLFLYQGNLTARPELLSEFTINTDMRPFVEYSAPRTHRAKRTGEAHAFLYEELLDFYDAVFAATPPEEDPVLANVPQRFRGLPRAGLEFARGRVLQGLGRPAAAKAAYGRSHEELARAFAIPPGGAPALQAPQPSP